MTPPAKFVHDEDGRRGAVSSLVSGNCIQRFRRTDKGVCLITQSMIDALG
jgi:glucose-1-phosphate adenylyltransferase